MPAIQMSETDAKNPVRCRRLLKKYWSKSFVVIRFMTTRRLKLMIHTAHIFFTAFDEKDLDTARNYLTDETDPDAPLTKMFCPNARHGIPALCVKIALLLIEIGNGVLPTHCDAPSSVHSPPEADSERCDSAETFLPLPRFPPSPSSVLLLF